MPYWASDPLMPPMARRAPIARLWPGRRWGLAVAVILLGLKTCSPALAAERLTIVAVGGSNTYGKGVSRADASPAQLKRLLREDGLDVAVRSEGVNGETTDRMLNALPSTVPPGTHIVILQPGSNDPAMLNRDARDTRANVEKMVATLRGCTSSSTRSSFSPERDASSFLARLTAF